MTNRTEPAAQPGRMALVGSGAYLPAMHDTEAWLLENRPPRYVQLATAAAPEGQRVLDTWHRLGAEAADRLGVEPVILDVRVRQDAFDPEHIRQVANAGLIYLSGGNPRHLASTLIDTPLWDAILEAWRAGASLAGCSAGAMALTGMGCSQLMLLAFYCEIGSVASCILSPASATLRSEFSLGSRSCMAAKVGRMTSACTLILMTLHWPYRLAVLELGADSSHSRNPVH